jgi:hypothetical protein
MKKPLFLITAFASCMCAFAAGPYLPDGYREAKPSTRSAATAPASDEPEGTPEAMVVAARREITLLQKHQDLGEPMIPAFAAAKSAASKRLLEAERLVARGKNDRDAEVAAVARQVERCREFRRVIQQRLNSGDDVSAPVLLTMVDYDLAEAKLLFARLKAEAATAKPVTRPASSP